MGWWRPYTQPSASGKICSPSSCSGATATFKWRGWAAATTASAQSWAGAISTPPSRGGEPSSAAVFEKHLTGRRRLLDVGCGVGEVAAYLKTTLGIREVCGVDIGQSCVEAAATRGVSAYQCDLDSASLPFGDGHFDEIGK